MKPQVLFRASRDEQEELEICKQFFDVVHCRTQLKDCLVIPRYSALPYYRELEQDVQINGCKLINTYEQHAFVADVFNWASPEMPLHGLTPRTYRNWSNLPEGAYVLKGKTNSRKNQWDTHMYAPTVTDVPKIARNLMMDSMISDQGIVVRDYVPLKQFDTGINGHPVTNEWRAFFYKELMLSCGYYWVNFPEAQEQAVLGPAGRTLLLEAAAKVSPYVDFFVLDVAETADGQWIIVEVNDGQMSGLSGCDPLTLYSNLKSALEIQSTIDPSQKAAYVGKQRS